VIEEYSIVLPSDEPTMGRTTNTGGPRRHRKVETMDFVGREVEERIVRKRVEMVDGVPTSAYDY
jgi:hypothetical protein